MCSAVCCAGLSQSVVSNSLRPHGRNVTHQAPLSMVFSKQEHLSGLPSPPPRIFPSQDRTQVSHIAGGFFSI